jgi:RNA-directed DNA polymerase
MGTGISMVSMQQRTGKEPMAQPVSSGRNPQGIGTGASQMPLAFTEQTCQKMEQLIEAVVDRSNMTMAFQRVVRNKGAAGIDRMTVDELQPFLNQHWSRIKERLLLGLYLPNAVRKVEIPKPDGGMRMLGIPTALDRLIGQAVYQVLEPIFDPGFSELSFGFRRNRSAHQAVEQGLVYGREGRNWVVDIDLEKFFDRVNHDVLMERVARKVRDKRVLKLIRRYLQAGIMTDGLVTARTEGTPQGSPLSPLLSNIMLDDLDKELEKRNHAFCRYADDCNIYVRSEEAGKRVMESMTQFLAKRLRLKVNMEKSSVGNPWDLKFLGYTMTREQEPRLRQSKRNVERLKDKLRNALRKGRGKSLQQVIAILAPLLRGWTQYFRLSGVRTVFKELDEWIRRRLRCVIWRHWKRPRTRMIKLIHLGFDRDYARSFAGNGRGAWWCAGSRCMNQAFPIAYLKEMGLLSLLEMLESLYNKRSRTAVYGTVRTVV